MIMEPGFIFKLMLIPRMIDDMLKLTIDKIFNSKMEEEGLENLSVSGVEDLQEGANERNKRRLTFSRRWSLIICNTCLGSY